MKKDKILIAVAIPGIVAVAGILFSLRMAASPEDLAGLATVAILLAIAALEYRSTGRRARARRPIRSNPAMQPSSPCRAAIAREEGGPGTTSAYAPASRLPKRSLSGLVALR